MFKNYLKIAFRDLRYQKLYAFINIFGLALGLTCFILIMLFVQHELSYDRFHEQADRIYRIVQRQPGNVYLGSDHFGVTPAPLAGTLPREFPEVEQATVFGHDRALLSYGEQHYYEEGLRADARFFEVFSFPLIRGNTTALSEPKNIVLTASLARKIFGEEDPVGKILRYQNKEDFTVAGVMEDIPRASHIKGAFVSSILSDDNYRQCLEENRWNSNSWFTYFTLAEETDARLFQTKMTALVEKYVLQGEDRNKHREANQYIVQKLTDIHLRSHINFEVSSNGDIKYVYLFGAIGFVILLLACVNYMNLAVARSMKRAREVGVRKVVGAPRGQLIRQFLIESILMTFLALLLAVVLSYLLVPVFGNLVQRPLGVDFVQNPLLVPGLITLVILVGIIAGSYPALFMSKLKPIQVIKGTVEGPLSRGFVQRLLVVVQYTVSIALVAVSLVIYEQLQYVQHKDVGYNREQVVTIPVRDQALRDQYETVRAELLRHPHIVAVTGTGHLPTNITSSTTLREWEGSNEGDEVPIYQTRVDYDFLQVFNIELASGQNFLREQHRLKEGSFLLNETAVKALGWDVSTAPGKTFNLWRNEGKVVGVVKDFHMHSMHMPIQPLMIELATDWMGYISVKVRPGNLPETIAHLEQTMRQFTPYPFEYQFLDEAFDDLYKAELRLGQTFGYFTLLALLIASLGLFGLAAFATERRTKEIGIRKALGASMTQVTLLMSREYTRLIILAAVPAIPIAYLAMNRWLEDFAYKIQISMGVFVVAIFVALLMAWSSISYQSIKAARINPAQSLKYE